MEVSEKEMLQSLSNCLITNEKMICPVLGSIKRNANKLRSKANDFAYIALTSFDRLLLYIFDEFSSHVDYYTFDTLIMGDVSKTDSGQYIVELSFLTEKGTKDLEIVFASSVKGKDFPHQPVNAKLLYNAIDKKIG